MTLDDINRRLEEIRVAAYEKADEEHAHGLEDELHEDVLREVVKGNPLAQELARLALTTLDMEFQRWYA